MKTLKNISFKLLVGLILISSFVFPLLPNRVLASTPEYFVLSTGVNNWSDTGIWSYNSDGSSTGAPEPDSSVNVYPSTSIASGAILTLDTVARCHDMDWTGVINDPTFDIANVFQPSGDVVFLPLTDMTITGNRTIQILGDYFTPGQPLGNIQVLFGNFVTPVTDLEGNLSAYSIIFAGNTTSDIRNTNGYSVMQTSDYDLQVGTVTLNITGSTITAAAWTCNSNDVIIYNSSSKIVLPNGGGSYPIGNFNGGGNSYPEVDFNGSGTYIISDSNTFADLVTNPAVSQTVKFTDGTTQTIGNCSLSGTVGNIHNLQGTSTGGWDIIKSGSGVVSTDYVVIDNSNASPLSIWSYGSNSTYNGTSGWASNVPTPTMTNTANTNEASNLAHIILPIIIVSLAITFSLGFLAVSPSIENLVYCIVFIIFAIVAAGIVSGMI